MREIIIICIILILILGLSICVQKFLTKTSKELTNKLEEQKINIEKLDNSERVKIKIENLNYEIFNKWEEINEKWSIIVLHDELDLIQMSLIKMKVQIKEENYSKALEEIETSIFLLEHISEKEKLTLINIF